MSPSITPTPTSAPISSKNAKSLDSTSQPMYAIPIADRPPHGTWFNTIMFPLLFNLGMIGINSAQFCALPLLIVPVVGRKMFNGVIDWTKDGFGRLLILITVLFAPTSLHISATTPPNLAHLIERDSQGRITKLNLPDRLVIMSNHQAYTDWMYMWILACYAGHARGMTILLKWSLRSVPIVGWGMRFFRFIFMKRSWAADRDNLTRALTRLGQNARASDELPAGGKPSSGDNTAGDPDDEQSALLAKAKPKEGRSPLWLLIFPEGTITSDEERAKSVRYADKEGIDDLVTMLHPRSTGLLFCLRTLLPQVPDLQLLDVTIGYPGVPLGKYPQDHYGLGSIFFRRVPPPSVHIHLHLHSNLSSPDGPIPSLISDPEEAVKKGSDGNGNGNTRSPTQVAPPSQTPVPLALPEEARAFELWLRQQWITKEKRLISFFNDQVFPEEKDGVEVLTIRQVKWYHWLSAMGGGGVGTLAVVGLGIWGAVVGAKHTS